MMRGDAAVAGALRTCADTFYAVPGYPVTEIARLAGAEPAISEKVALEYALGDSLAGRRSAVILKNVGLNACADPLVNATTQGIGAGVVIIAGDDLSAKGSQNTQDSRYYGELAQVPVLEPDSGTCAAAVSAAFDASEQFSRVAVVRVTPALLEHDVTGTSCTRTRQEWKGVSRELTMLGRSQAAENGTAAMFAWSTSSPLNRFSGGVIAAGPAKGDSHVVTVYPPPAGIGNAGRIHELGRPFLQEHRGIRPPAIVPEPETYASRGYYRTFCRECPFRTLMGILATRKMEAACDIGCSMLAANPPYRVGKSCYALGSSIAVAARSVKVALTGDYALLHSGMNALMDVYEKRLPLLAIVLKNDRMGMTGGQEAYDLMKYLAWAEPVVCRAGDRERLEKELAVKDAPRTLVVEGACPEGSSHETVEC